MTRKYNTVHPERSLSGYHFKGKVKADRYGEFKDGQQLSPDYICGKKVFYRDKEQEHKAQKRTGKWPNGKIKGIRKFTAREYEKEPHLLFPLRPMR